MNALPGRVRLTFPPGVPAGACPNCGEAPVTVEEGRVLWTHDCGAYGYYDDGSNRFPLAAFRVIGDPLLRFS